LDARSFLDSFRDHLEVQRVAEIDRRPHDDIVVLGLELLDERPIDLDLIHRQSLQVRE
jgi:hypothetical protein